MAKKPDPVLESEPQPRARRVPLEPVDFFGRPVRRLAPAPTHDLVEGWKRVALAASTKAPQTSARPALRVHVTVGFVLLSLAVGSPFGLAGALASLLTLGSLLLAQELPRALMARAIHRPARLVISATGSETELDGPGLTTARAFVASLAGSLTNLATALALNALAQSGLSAGAAPWLASAAIAHALWGILQLLPVVPFRAGRAVAARLPLSLRLAHAAVSVACVGAVGLLGLRWTTVPIAFSLVVFSAASAVAALRDAFSEHSDEHAGVASLATAAEAHLHADEPDQAVRLAQRALGAASRDRYRSRLHRTLAWAAIGKGDPFLAHAAVGQLPTTGIDVHLVAAYLACCNRIDEAVRLLLDARDGGQRAPETTRLLLELLVRQGAASKAWEIACADRALLAARDWSAVQGALGYAATSSGALQ